MDLSNTLEGIQVDFKKFKDYRTVEKHKYKEKVEIEEAYFDIQIRQQNLRLAPYVPPEGEGTQILFFCSFLMISSDEKNTFHIVLF